MFLLRLAAASVFIWATVAVAQSPPGYLQYLGTGQFPLTDPFHVALPYTGGTTGGEAPYTNTAGYTKVTCPTNPTYVIPVLGQSLLQNSATDGSYVVQYPTQNLTLNIFDGYCYETQIVMLGAAYSPAAPAQTPLARLGDDLIAAGAASVVIVPFMVGGSTVAQWTDAQDFPYYYNNISLAARRLAAAGLTATHIVWEQGETDCLNGTTQSAYTASLATVISGLQSSWPGVPILVDKETWIEGTTCSTIQNAQTAAINGTTIFSGANMDTLGSGDRQSDNTHLNATGSAAAASLLSTAIRAVP